ncbi:MAG: DUF4331 family protein [Candidatus Eisenbacteria bacterium]
MRVQRGLTPLLCAVFLAGAANLVQASSHRESYTIAKDPTIDNLDVYAFVSPDQPNTVTIAADFIPFQEASNGPNFYNFDENAYYYIKVDNVGDAMPHIVFEFKFTTTVQNGNTFLYNTGPITSLTDPDFNLRQTYTVTRYDNGAPTVLGSNLPVPPVNIGPKSTPNYADLARTAIMTLSDGTKVFAGQRDDPFFIDTGAHFDLLTVRRPPGNLGGGIDGLGGFNIHSIALQIPMQRLTKNGGAVDPNNNIIGIWSTSERLASRTLNADGTSSESGAHVQVSRLGNPLVNEEVIPRKDKDKFNSSQPSGDGQFLPYVLDPEPARLISQIFGIAVPPAPRNDLVAVFLTGITGITMPAGVTPGEEMRLNMAIAPTATPSRLGVLGGDLGGYPNGRRPIDDVFDITVRAAAGGYPLTPDFNHAPNNLLGDGVDFNDRPFLPYFPYLATPHQGFCHRHHLLSSTTSTTLATSAARGRGHGPKFNDGDCADKADEGDDDGDDDKASAVPTSEGVGLSLLGPNPGLSSKLAYTLEKPAHVSLTVLDLQGRLVRSLIDQDAAAGTFSAAWDGRDQFGARAQRGVYFARYSVNGKVMDSRKVILQ